MPTPPPPRLILASRSPRRAELLRDAGFSFEVRTPPFDDPPQPDTPEDGDTPALAVRLATAKAQSLAKSLEKPGESQTPRAVILAADTLCIDAHGRPLGKPQTRDQLLNMLRGFVDRTHRVTTGVCLLAWPDQIQSAFADTAHVHWGPVHEEDLQAYADTDAWAGKAGGYNFHDRVAAGWPVTADGDPATVVGLPMAALVPRLAEFGVTPGVAAR